MSQASLVPTEQWGVWGGCELGVRELVFPLSGRRGHFIHLDGVPGLFGGLSFLTFRTSLNHMMLRFYVCVVSLKFQKKKSK